MSMKAPFHLQRLSQKFILLSATDTAISKRGVCVCVLPFAGIYIVAHLGNWFLSLACYRNTFTRRKRELLLIQNTVSGPLFANKLTLGIRKSIIRRYSSLISKDNMPTLEPKPIVMNTAVLRYTQRFGILYFKHIMLLFLLA